MIHCATRSFSRHKWNVSPLDVGGGNHASCQCQNASEIALHEAKGEKPRDNWNRRKSGKT
jgi:hypothetical protein